MTSKWLYTLFALFWQTVYINGDRCFLLDDIANLKLRIKERENISIVVSNDSLNQIVSHIHGIFATEVLGYDVIYEPISLKLNGNATSDDDLITDTLKQLGDQSKNKISLGVWLTPGYDTGTRKTLEMIGRLSTGHYGWFVPKRLHAKLSRAPQFLSYNLFTNASNVGFDHFVLNADMLSEFNVDSEYVPTYCEYEKCATILAGHRIDTNFVVHHINHFKLRVRVVWLGDELWYAIHKLMAALDSSADIGINGKAFIVLHRTPSEIIDTDIAFQAISMFACEDIDDINDDTEILCPYETTPIMKYCSTYFTNKFDLPIHSVSQTISMNRNMEKLLLRTYNQRMQEWFIRNANERLKSKTMPAAEKMALVESIACDYIKQNQSFYHLWIDDVRSHLDHDILLGTFYPNQEEDEDEHNGISNAVEMAMDDIRRYQRTNNFLPKVNFKEISDNCGCSVDRVLDKASAYSYQPHNKLGFLGPWCSETVESIRGISKNSRMLVVSYAAEGISFADRDKYPYFFGTIGEFHQYDEAYVRVFKALNWTQAVAYSEDGRKHTEYITHLESQLKQNDILLTNIKFWNDSTATKIGSSLHDLKDKNSNIIIADIHDKQAAVVLCEAYKLQLTAENGYVWFLPHRLEKNTTKLLQLAAKDGCTELQLNEMLEGHFSLSQPLYADDSAAMETDGTVAEWKADYLGVNSSHYGSYAYDAVWVYALALDKYLKDPSSDISQLHSEHATQLLTKIIAESDINGVSGRIRFSGTGSRISTIHIYQWLNNEHNRIGIFEPNVTRANNTNVIIGGQFNFNVTNIKWLTQDGKQPKDRRNLCSVQGLANAIGLNCAQTMLLFTVLLCLFAVIVISLASFIFWKRRYDMKLKTSAKIMRTFGIDLKSMTPLNANTLDKWEISKDHVVINRRLGEGAFGTVYGGEAQITGDTWTAVAVKTLKKGSNPDDRLDFLSEAEAMKRFDHGNIIKLLGVCLQSEPIYAVMEFMLYGDLKTYLLARRHLVNDKINDDSDISPKRLTMMALDAAKALAYLSEMKYVHRDVACRNCLVNAQRVVKLGDFGMARSTSDNDYYRFRRKGMLPVRWMAPESLSLGKFTPASDIWSFGVLLFEIITFGSFPFQGMTNTQVLDYIKLGKTLAIPNGIKPELEDLLQECWNLSCVKRPLATEIVELLHQRPKLITPSLDVPLASVQIFESDSDQLNAIPDLSGFGLQPAPEQESTFITMNDRCPPTPNGIMLSQFHDPHHDFFDIVTRNTLNTTNPLEPLLAYANDNGDDRYVPMMMENRYVPMDGNKMKNK